MVHFTQAAALEQAQALTSTQRLHPGRTDAIAVPVGDFRFAAGFGKTLCRFLRHGIGVHHAGMLPKYRRLVETLCQARLAEGRMRHGHPWRRHKYANKDRSFHRVVEVRRARAGSSRPVSSTKWRGGPAGLDDTSGRVVVQAPEHAVENDRALAKAGDDPRRDAR